MKEVQIVKKYCYRSRKVRYLILDSQGHLLDNAQGYGYKSPDKALASYSYKLGIPLNFIKCINNSKLNLS